MGWGAYIMVIALSVHSILEGVAIGLADTSQATITLFLSVIIHEVRHVMTAFLEFTVNVLQIVGV